MKTLYAFLAAAVTFTVLDYIWLAHIMKKFYLDSLSHLTTIRDGSLVVNFPAAVLFYLLALFTAYWFVVREATTLQGAFLSGALLGFCMYAFYDFTNLATLRDYPLSLALVDTAWGTFLVACVSAVMFFFVAP